MGLGDAWKLAELKGNGAEGRRNKAVGGGERSRARITKGDEWGEGGWQGAQRWAERTRKLNWQAQVALKPDYLFLLAAT